MTEAAAPLDYGFNVAGRPDRAAMPENKASLRDGEDRQY